MYDERDRHHERDSCREGLSEERGEERDAVHERDADFECCTLREQQREGALVAERERPELEAVRRRRDPDALGVRAEAVEKERLELVAAQPAKLEADGEAAVEWESTPYSLKLEGELRAHRTNNEKLLHELSTSETQVIKLKAALIERDNQVAALQAKLETLNGMSPTRRPPVQLSERPREPLSPAEAVSRAMDSPIVSFPSNRSRPTDYSTGRNLTFATDRSPASPTKVRPDSTSA